MLFRSEGPAQQLAENHKLFQILFNAAVKTRSKANLDRADALLAAAAAHGSKDALALGAVWPRLKADAQRKNSGSNTP